MDVGPTVPELIPSAVLYAGAIMVCAGLLGLVRPSVRLRIPTRRRAVAVLALGMTGFLAGLLWPPHESTVLQPRTTLDRLMPAWQFGEHHSVRVHAAPDIVYRSMRDVTADEIAFYRILTWIRSPRLSRPARENILAPGSGSLLDSAVRGGFTLMAEDPPREIVVGTLFGRVPRTARRRTAEEFLSLNGPGIIRVMMNFRIDAAEAGWSTIETDTRVSAPDVEGRRVFGRYWRVIYPGSAIIRIAWLRAIKGRAERSNSS